MAYDFLDYQNSPNDMYRELMQAFIDEQWTNTSAKTPENNGALREQDNIGSACYSCVEAWIKPTVAETSTGSKDPYDYITVIFKDINHQSARGLYYQYCDDYWIVHDSGIFDGLPKAIGLQRCNNWLRIVDPENGAIFQAPCVVEYDMSAPSLQVSTYINTPNNHAKVLVQGNADTLRLFKYNTRYMLNGRPFKLYAWQNAVNGAGDDEPTYMRLDLFLDEQHAGDDPERRLADNGKFDYAISFKSDTYYVEPNQEGRFEPVVTLNGNEVSRELEWRYDRRMLDIKADGAYTVFGQAGDETSVEVYIKGNTDVAAKFTVVVQDSIPEKWDIRVTPEISVIRQYESFDVVIAAMLNGNIQADADIEVSCDSDALSVMPSSNGVWRFTGIKITAVPVLVNIRLKKDGETLVSQYLEISVVSMLGD